MHVGAQCAGMGLLALASNWDESLINLPNTHIHFECAWRSGSLLPGFRNGSYCQPLEPEPLTSATTTSMPTPTKSTPNAIYKFTSAGPVQIYTVYSEQLHKSRSSRTAKRGVKTIARI